MTNTPFQSQDPNQAFGNPFNIAYHVHNGADAPQVPFENIGNYQSYVIFKRTVVQSNQILALNTTPVVLVPPPILGAIGTIKQTTIVTGVGAYLTYGGTAYTGANNLEFRYTDGSGIKVTADMGSAFLNSAASGFNYAPAITTAFVPVNNASIVVRVPVADPATGNSSITFVVYYRIISY